MGAGMTLRRGKGTVNYYLRTTIYARRCLSAQNSSAVSACKKSTSLSDVLKISQNGQNFRNPQVKYLTARSFALVRQHGLTFHFAAC